MHVAETGRGGGKADGQFYPIRKSAIRKEDPQPALTLLILQGTHTHTHTNKFGKFAYFPLDQILSFAILERPPF